MNIKREENPEEFEGFAIMTWCPHDLLTQSECKNWSVEKRKAFLERIEDKLVDSMVSDGWNFIKYALEEFKEEDLI